MVRHMSQVALDPGWALGISIRVYVRVIAQRIDRYTRARVTVAAEERSGCSIVPGPGCQFCGLRRG